MIELLSLPNNKFKEKPIRQPSNSFMSFYSEESKTSTIETRIYDSKQPRLLEDSLVSSIPFSTLKPSQSYYQTGNVFLENSLDVEKSLKKYFASTPNKRVHLRKGYAQKIKTVEQVLEVLKLGNTRNIKDAYDSAIAILAECDAQVLTKTMQRVHNLLIHNSIKLRQFEQDWEILIKGVACSERLSSHKKLRLITSLLSNNLSRLIKTAIIDALMIIEGEIDGKLIQERLQSFLSKQETDEYVRSYAQEAIDDLS